MAEDTNKLFVGEIEKRPCLYDFTNSAYADKDFQEIKWQEIADIVGSTVEECKARWRNLRGGLTRYLSKPMTLSGSRAAKKYYLYDDLHFLLPFIKTRVVNCKKDPLSNSSDFDYLNEGSTYDGDSSDFDVKPSIVMDTEVDTKQLFQDKEPPNRKRGHTPEENEPVAHNTKVPKETSRKEDSFGEAVKMYFAERLAKEANPDLEFFKSILPDIADFNAFQKRLFKRKVLEIIDEISQVT
ncbi:hypothetical protein WA026_007207 [Henosepilachna vigintioctopunctata]|uniref:Transcription factor Adf-1 n=1 Tax=Henosepilachna vigintioctopunctata TaxID=420089 RepID=A0AAW1VD25_9CUCU